VPSITERPMQSSRLDATQISDISLVDDKGKLFKIVPIGFDTKRDDGTSKVGL